MCIKQVNFLGINSVLSLFDGISCGQIALNKVGIKYKNYFASEIDIRAINVTMENYPNTIQLRDIINIKSSNLPEIDLMMRGSSCQLFSLAGTKTGMVTSENIDVLTLEKYLELKADGYVFKGYSYLFWEYVRLLKEIKPKYFLLENVMMSPKWKNVITEALGVRLIEINSSLLSFQSRKRLYWTNIPFETLIEDKKILFCNNYFKVYDESLVSKSRELNKIKRPKSRICSIYSEKLPTLLKEQENKATDSILIKHRDVYRYPTREESEMMQTVPIGYTKNAKYNDAMGLLGNRWTVDVIAHFFKLIDEPYSLIDDIVKEQNNWLMINTMLDVEKIVDLGIYLKRKFSENI
jgi:DNA (cytosine-5)-methyltransferase 3A